MGSDSESLNVLWVRVYSHVPGSERDVRLVGQARRTLSECRAGAKVPLEGGEPPPSPPGGRRRAGADDQEGAAAAVSAAPATLEIRACRWARLRDGAGLGAEPRYRGDLEFMDEALAAVGLDARTEETVRRRRRRRQRRRAHQVPGPGAWASRAGDAGRELASLSHVEGYLAAPDSIPPPIHSLS